jgi:hypothetical protein
LPVQKPDTAKKRNALGVDKVATAFFDMLGTIVEKFGWPGTLVLFGMYFIERHATDHQKSEIVDMYVLGHGISHQWPIMVVSVVSIAALWAQKRHYGSKVAAINGRLDEAAAEKSRLQEELAGKKLNHGPISPK